jgi:hypothetical protein
MLQNIDIKGLGKESKDTHPTGPAKPPPPPWISPSLLPSQTAPLIAIVGTIIVAGILLTNSKK